MLIFTILTEVAEQERRKRGVTEKEKERERRQKKGEEGGEGKRSKGNVIQLRLGSRVWAPCKSHRAPRPEWLYIWLNALLSPYGQS